MEKNKVKVLRLQPKISSSRSNKWYNQPSDKSGYQSKPENNRVLILYLINLPCNIGMEMLIFSIIIYLVLSFFITIRVFNEVSFSKWIITFFW